MISRTIALPHPLDLRATLDPLRHGPADPTIRFSRAAAMRAGNTPDGPASIEISIVDRTAVARAWGEGSSWILDILPELIGSHDRPEDLVARDSVVRELQRRSPGLRMCRSRAVVDVLVPTILGQRVTSVQAHRSYRSLVLKYGEPAPGPFELFVPPQPKVLASIPYFELHTIGIERSRADIIRRACSRSGRLEEAAAMEPTDAHRRLRAISGIGPWTVACVVQAALGDPDSVILGDYHLPNIVAWSLAGEPRGNDARMLELLKPYEGQRGRVVRMLKTMGSTPPKYGPKHRIRDLSQI